MKAKRNVFQKLEEFFFPPDHANIKAVREVIPFFGLVTIALIWMYSIYIQQIESVMSAVIYSLLMLLHLILYWAVFRFMNDLRSLRLYFIFQGVLIFVILQFAGDFGMVIGLYASLIGNAVGSLRRSRDLFLFIPGYLLLAGLAITLKSGIEQILQWYWIALPSILISGFVSFMFRRQLEMRDNAERLLAELQEAHSKLEIYAEQVEELTLTQERQRIARELHDTLAQEMTGMVLQLEAVSTHIEKDNPDRAQEILQEAMRQSRTTLAEARKVIDDLRSEPFPAQSFEQAIQEEAARFESLSGIPCEISIDLVQNLGGETRQHLFKIISEGLNNIAKHANAKSVWMKITEIDNGYHLVIEDNGRGFDLEEEREQQGQYGLIGIQERVELLHGNLMINSQVGKGTRLEIHIPHETVGEPHG